MTQRAEAAAIADAYLTLSDDGRRNFFLLLAREFWTDPRRRSTTRSTRCASPTTAAPPSGALRDALDADRPTRCCACSPASTAA